MIEVLLIAVGAVVVIFGVVVLYGAPYLPSLSSQVDVALDLVDLKEGQHLLELGCGDGKVIIAAAERGLRVTGYELNPILACIAWARTRRYGAKVTIIWGNFWRRTMPQTDGIFVFLLPKYMDKLDKKITQEISRPVKLVSFAFKIPDKEVAAQREGIFLYHYKLANDSRTYKLPY